MNVLPDAHYAEGLKLLPNDRTMRMHTYVCAYVCNCDNGFLCRNFQLPLLHFMGSLGFYSLGELQLLPLGSRHIRHVCAGTSLQLSLLPLRVMIMTSYNIKVVYRNFGFRSFLFFFYFIRN